MAVVNVPPLDFYTSAASLGKIAELAKEEDRKARLFDPEYCKKLNLTIHQVKALQTFDAGSYQVTAFPAIHDASVGPLLYALKDADRTIFYGANTAILPEETWEGFHLHKLQFDVVILDHTYGPGFSGDDHLDALKFIEYITRLRDERLLTEQARIFATHISHEGNPVHPDLVDYAAQHGYEIAYDGLVISC